MFITPIRLSALALSAAVLAAGCASTGTDPDAPSRAMAQFEGDPRLGEADQRICFSGNIDSFSDTTDRTVVVESGVNKHYLLEIAGFCPNLDHAQSLAIDGFSSCLSRGDAIIAYDSAFGDTGVGMRPQRCLISDIYAWDPEAEAPAEGDADEPTENAEG